MARVYTKKYTEHYTNFPKAEPALVVPVGKKRCFAIPFPTEGFLNRLVVSQSAGTEVNFEVELLTSKFPFAVGVHEPDAEPADNLEEYRVQVPPTAALTADAGDVLTLADDSFGLSFRNVDGSFTENARYLYLIIKPVDAVDETEWNVSISCYTEPF